MSGGGKKPAPATPQESKPEIKTTTVQPFMPGMDQLLAGQLAQGFGGNPDDYLSAFSQTYAPMTLPQSFAPPSGQSPEAAQNQNGGFIGLGFNTFDNPQDANRDNGMRGVVRLSNGKFM